METICSFETSVDTQQTTRRYIPEDGTLHNHRCENLRSYNLLLGYFTTLHQLLMHARGRCQVYIP
jgi:hypothetical protein